MKKSLLSTILLVTLLLLSVAFVSANEYVSVLQNEGTFPTGNFNQGLFSPPQTTTSRSIASPTMMPLVADLNGDGINEIVVMDGGAIKIYHGSGLILDSASGTLIQFYDSTNRPTSWVIADLNDDGKKEIIIATLTTNAYQIAFMNYNGTTLTNAFNVSRTISAVGIVASGETSLGCDDVNNECLILFSHTSISAIAGNTQRWSAGLFNLSSSGLVITEGLISETGNIHSFCLPHITEIAVTDSDGDGLTDFTGTILHVNTGGGTDRLRLVNFKSLFDNLTVTAGISVTDINSGNVADIVTNNCRNDITGNTFTSPLVAELDGSGGNGKEMVFATMHNGNSFGMYAYHGNTGALIDDFPEATFTDGTLTGGVFRADAFDHSGSLSEFCTSGFVTNATENKTSILCGSLVNTADGFDSANYDVVTNYNISSLRDAPWSTLVGSSQQDHTSYSGFNGNGDYSEVVTTFGVFRLTKSFFNAILEPVWYNQDHFNLTSQRNGVMIAVDVENVSASDLLYLTAGSLYYFNDGFTNSPAELTNLHTNPCLNTTWKQNTTVSVDVTADDVNNDDIHCQAYLYYGTSDQQFVNDSGFITHGFTHSYSFTAFNITGTAVGRVECYDTHNPTLPDSTQFTFSVNTNGVSFGDCETNIGFIDVAPTNFTNTTTTPSNTNVISNLLAQANASTGLGTTILWLLLMGIVAIGGMVAIMREGHSTPHIGMIALAIVGFTEALLLIMGVFFGYIGLGVLFTIVIVCVAIATFLVRKMLFGSG